MPISRIAVFGNSIQIFDEKGVESVNFSMPHNGQVLSQDEHEIVVRAGDATFVYGDRGQLISSR